MAYVLPTSLNPAVNVAGPRSQPRARVSAVFAGLLFAALLLPAGCGTDTPTGVGGGDAGLDGATGDAGNGASTTPTFHRDIAPIVFAKCASCHLDGAIGPFDITKPAVAKAMAPAIAASVASGRMPPWGAQDTAECTPPKPWQNDARLTQAEKDSIAAWAKAGAPLGDAADSAQLTVAKPVALSRIDRTLVSDKGFVAEGTKDQFVCFPFDPKITTDSWIQGVNFIAGNPLVAHHALLFLDPTGAAAKAAGTKGWYDGFGSCNVNGGLVAAWAPGAVPVEMPAGAGIPIKKGERLVMQMHYHPIGAAAAVDKTKVQLKITSETPKYEVQAALIGNARKASQGLEPGEADDGKVEFRIPAGAASHAESISWTMPLSLAQAGISHIRVMGIASHMHYLGVDMRIWVERRTSSAAPALCSAGDKGTLEPCVTTNCAGAAGDALTNCAIANCTKQLQSIAPGCVGCLTEVLKTGKADLWAPCLAAGTLPPGPAGSDKDMCLLHTPAYDFAWQRFYTYQAPIEALPALRPGDTLKMRCVYNNSTSNPVLVKALSDQGLKAPVDVGIGDTTLDEMCLTGLYLLRDVSKK